MLRLFCLATLFLVATGSVLRGQTSPKLPAETDPNAYLAAASERMLSRVQGGTPFQLKGHFTASGAKESTGSGTYEETWLSPEKWRIEISLGPYHCVRVHKSDATYQLTPDSYEPAAVGQVLENVIPTLHVNKDASIGRTTLAGNEVIRVGKGEATGRMTLPESAWYFTASKNTPFVHAEGYEVTTFTRAGSLEGKLALLDFNVIEYKTKVLSFQTDTLVSNPPIEESLFTVPSSVPPFQVMQTHVSGEITKGKALHTPQPMYPPMALSQHIQGTVILAATIDTHGLPHEVRVLLSPSPLLSTAAVDTVRTWTYSPTLIDGKPVELKTQISVNFTFGRPEKR